MKKRSPRLVALEGVVQEQRHGLGPHTVTDTAVGRDCQFGQTLLERLPGPTQDIIL